MARRVLTSTIERRSVAEGRKLFRKLESYVASRRRIPVEFYDMFESLIVDSALFAISAGNAAAREVVLKKIAEFSFEREIFREIPVEQYDGISAFLAYGAQKLAGPQWNRIRHSLLFSINEMIAENLDFTQASRLVRRNLAEVGASPSNFYHVNTILTTAIHEAFNTQLKNALSQPIVYENLWGYRYLTAGDERVRPNHYAQHGVTLPKEHSFWDWWWPPNGYNCRCSIEPLFEAAKIKEPNPEFEPDPGFGAISPFFGIGGVPNVSPSLSFSFGQSSCPVCTGFSTV